MYTCTHCSVQSRRLENSGELLKNCPMRFHPEVTDTPQPEYFLPENHEFYVRASELEAAGYGQYPRIREIIELCCSMGHRKIGLAFCA